MGQTTSHFMDPQTPARTLRDRSVESLADFIKNDKAKRIVVFVGAGVSTSAGIPDFRSKDTGLYANLARLNLPHPEAVFDIDFFRENPLPFYTLAQELYPGRYKPTWSHYFIRLLHERGLLLKLYTQNIDCLDRYAGIPTDKIIEAHGSFATQRCIDCKKPFPDQQMEEAVKACSVPHCIDSACNGLVKPDIVFFGESLPNAFHESLPLLDQANVCIVMGTSLSVRPFAMLPSLIEDGVPRLLINLEHVGDFGTRSDDVTLIGDCDTGVRKLAHLLGWEEQLEILWRERHEGEVLTKLPLKEPATVTSDNIDSIIDNLLQESNLTLEESSTHIEQTSTHLIKAKKPA